MGSLLSPRQVANVCPWRSDLFICLVITINCFSNVSSKIIKNISTFKDMKESAHFLTSTTEQRYKYKNPKKHPHLQLLWLKFTLGGHVGPEGEHL